jgi:hypothetical protein
VYEFAKKLVRDNSNLLPDDIIGDIERYVASKWLYNNPKDFGKVFNHIDELENVYNLFRMKEYRNKHILFGYNPYALLNREGVVVRIIDNPSEPHKEIIGEVNVEVLDDGVPKVIKKYIAVVDKKDFVLGQQEGQLINVEPSDIQKGIVAKIELKDGVVLHEGKTYKAKDSKIVATVFDIKENEYFDFDVAGILANNRYQNFKRDLGTKVFDELFQNAIDHKIIISAEEFSRLPAGAQREMYVEVTNPFLTKTYGKWYVLRRFESQLNGTEGINIYKSAYKFTNNDSISRIVTNGIKGIVALTEVARNYVIKARLSSYINSYLSTLLIGAINTSNTIGYLGSMTVVPKYVKDYRTTMAKASYLEATGKTKEAEALRKKLYERNIIARAMDEGLDQTLLHMNYIGSNFNRDTLTKLINSLNDKTGSSKGSMQETLKHIALGDDTKLGKILSNIYEKTELYPKLAFFMTEYLVNKKKGMSNNQAFDLAMQKTLMAHPTYHNISAPMAVVERFHPFLQYYLNVPKMFLFSLNNNPHKLALVTAIYKYSLSLSYQQLSEEERRKTKWFKEHDFAVVARFGDKALLKATGSIYPYDMDILGGFKPNDLFALQVWDNIVERPTAFFTGFTVKQVRN